MSRQILIDTFFGWVRTAIAEGKALLDYYEEPPESGSAKGNIYKGTVKKVEAGMGAAFIRYGASRDGFLALRDATLPGHAAKSLKPGDELLVQVIKDEVGEKGAALTARLSFAGRYLVFIPGKESDGGISGRIPEKERAPMRKVLAQLQIPEGVSVILRTAGLDREIGELQADVDRLAETHRQVLETADRNGPSLVFREAPPVLRYLREYYTPEVDRIWVNQSESLEECRRFFFLYEPKSASKVTLSPEGPLMFRALGLEAEVKKLASRRVNLASGANIVIDQTEALVAVDVNSARSKGEAIPEEARFAVNMEAAAEIARQLRLRDLGGIIAVDFIDMEEDGHRRKVEEAMRKAFSPDKAKVKVFEIGPLGLMQISRQRLRKAGPHFHRLACEVCQGLGWHASPETAALEILREMEDRLRSRKTAALSVVAPFPAANRLMNDFRAHILDMEKRHGCAIKVEASGSQTGEPVLTPTPASKEGSPREGRAEAAGEGRPEIKRVETVKPAGQRPKETVPPASESKPGRKSRRRKRGKSLPE